MLVSTVELFWRARRAGPLGLGGTEGLTLDWGALVARKKEIVASWSAGTKPSLEQKGIAVFEGRARFAGANELGVNGRSLSARRFVIATGSSPARPPIPGIERAVTSDEFFDLPARPERLVVIGGGFIGFELGFALARAGSRVTILQAGADLLPRLDAELRDALVALGREAGMEFLTGAEVKGIAPDRTVEAQVRGEMRRFPADAVLAATGRPPNTAQLALDRASVATDRGAVRVNEYLASVTAPHIYATGDTLPFPQHTPLAWYTGELAGHNAARGNERKADIELLPTAVFTIPAAAQVGRTEPEARAAGLKVATKRMSMKSNPAAGVRDETEGLVKVVYEEGSDRLVGMQMLGAGAEDLIHVAAVALRCGLKRGEMAAMHYVFPTLAGTLFDVLA